MITDDDRILNPRIPESIRPTLEAYLHLINQHLPDFMNAFYMVGSIALDGFNDRFSDIDFVAVLSHEASTAEMEKLRRIHKTIEREYPDWKLSGGYFQVRQLGCVDQIDPYPYYHDGKLRRKDPSEANLITWWILKNHGIAVLSTVPDHLSFAVDWNLLLKRMKENLNSYWMRWADRPVRCVMLLSDWGIQWAVLGVLRQFYTFRENSITTKVKAAEYALACMPGRWHSLIQEAIDIREGKKHPGSFSRISRAGEAVSFLKYVIETCNAEF